jgi:hypothetical protein
MIFIGMLAMKSAIPFLRPPSSHMGNGKNGALLFWHEMERASREPMVYFSRPGFFLTSLLEMGREMIVATD